VSGMHVRGSRPFMTGRYRATPCDNNLFGKLLMGYLPSLFKFARESVSHIILARGAQANPTS
jgi:hypothetical protein